MVYFSDKIHVIVWCWTKLKHCITILFAIMYVQLSSYNGR
jgi:hypothetical protein